MTLAKQNLHRPACLATSWVEAISGPQDYVGINKAIHPPLPVVFTTVDILPIESVIRKGLTRWEAVKTFVERLFPLICL